MITLDELNRIIKSKRSMTAEEAKELFESCPEWVAQNAAREAKRVELEVQLKLEEEPLIADLARIGIKITSIWDLVNMRDGYTRAIPVLIKHLDKPYHSRIREGVIRALTIPDARGVVGTAILRELRTTNDSELRWVLANALTVVSERSDAAAIQSLLDDPNFDDVSERLGKALKNLKSVKTGT